MSQDMYNEENLIYLDLLQSGYTVYGWQNGRFQFAFYAYKEDQKIAIAFDNSWDKNEIRKTARKLAKIWEKIQKYVIVPEKQTLWMRKFEEQWVKIITLDELKL